MNLPPHKQNADSLANHTAGLVLTSLYRYVMSGTKLMLQLQCSIRLLQFLIPHLLVIQQLRVFEHKAQTLLTLIAHLEPSRV
jgi:hypothetical protein